jgi:uncharacterized protein YigA (DUF484 family)
MTSASKPQPAAGELNPEDVAQYLQSHPEFFEHNPALLDSLQIPHKSGAAVSLIERQVSTLRQKNLQLERKLRDLVDIARSNDMLAGKVHELATHLMAARTRVHAVEIAEELLRSSFSADQSVLVLFEHAHGEFDSLARNGRFLRLAARGDAALGPFRTFLDSGAPRCGRIRDTQRLFLFGEDADEIGSAALVPLGADAATGFLGIGSRDADYFHPGMSMDFLARLGDLLGCALAVR